jgi:hypothetical protein
LEVLVKDGFDSFVELGLCHVNVDFLEGSNSNIVGFEVPA